MKRLKDIHIYIILAISMAIYSGCSSPWADPISTDNGRTGNPGERWESQESRKVMLLYIDGYNNLQSYLTTNIEDLKTGWLPKDNRSNDVLLVYHHLSKTNSDLSTPTIPVLIKLSTDYSGKAKVDTLVRYSTDVISSSAAQLREVLTYVKETFEAKSYGLIYSSHGTGFLPAGYYNRPNSYVFQESSKMYRGSANGIERLTAVPYEEQESDPSRPMVKSIGQSVHNGLSYEMEIADLAAAIPMKLDYFLFDACLMGGIEVAYELKEKCDKIAFSQAEVLAQGFNYKTITQHLLNNNEVAYPDRVCQDYIDYYTAQSGAYKSATVSLIDCNKLEPIAEICSELFSKYREELGKISPSKVQGFYTGNHHWFYDLKSIISQMGATADELQQLQNAMDECVLYKGHTPEFLSEFSITVFSGFSMYLPCNGGAELDKYYRTLKWNKATGLVE